MEERSVMVRWVVGSIPPTELLLFPASAPQLVHVKESLRLIGKSSPCSGGSGFLNDPLPDVLEQCVSVWFR